MKYCHDYYLLIHNLFYIADGNDQRKVIVKKLALVVEGRDDMELDLTGDLSQLKKQVIHNFEKLILCFEKFFERFKQKIT